MTHVSRRLLDREAYQLLNSLLEEAFVDLNTTESKSLIGTVISGTEAEMIKKRLGIFLLLDLGVGFNEITTFTKTTPETVSRLKLIWDSTPSRSKQVIRKRLKKVYAKKKITEILKSLLDINISYSNYRRKLAGLPKR